MATAFAKSMPHDHNVDEIVSRWVYAQIDKWRNEDPPLTYQRIADTLGCTKTHAIALHRRRGGVGRRIERSFANAQFGGSVDKLRESAKQWWELTASDRTSPLEEHRKIVADLTRRMRTPENLRRLIDEARPSESTCAMLALVATFRGDFSVPTWRRLAQAFERDQMEAVERQAMELELAGLREVAGRSRP